MIKPMRVCFDLDNTLVTFPKTKEDYTTVEPIPGMIAYVRYLKRLGHNHHTHRATNEDVPWQPRRHYAECG